MKNVQLNNWLRAEVNEELDIMLADEAQNGDGSMVLSDYIDLNDTETMIKLYNLLGEVIEKRRMKELGQ